VPRSAGHVRPVTEAAFTGQVLTLARLLGWRRAHFRPARTAGGWRTPVQGDGAGFPDLLLIQASAGRLLVAELKAARGRLTAEQAAWLRAFEAAGVPAYVWRPADWPEIERVLRG
jgi:VRR-NUC domain